MGETNPEITDHSESNILVVIISMFSGVAEMINYYIDNMAREAFITTARRYSSVVKHTRLIDYRIKSSIPASTNIQVTYLNSLNENTITAIPITIPQGTQFFTNNNVVFISVSDVIVEANTNSINIPVEQKQYLLDIYMGNTTASEDSVYEIGTNYVHNSMLLKVGGEIWTLVDTLGRSGPEDKHYIVEITADRVAIIKFGDGINGKIPNAGLDILGNYYITQGSLGNVNANTINQTNFVFDTQAMDVSEVKITNPYSAVAGTDYESIEKIRRSAPLHLRTLDRAVTRQDYIDIAMLAPGVDKATVHFDCGKNVEVYISPNGGGIASTTLLESTKEYIDRRKMITTFIDVKPAGESQIILDVEVWARFRMDPIQTRADIINALEKAYNYEASGVNRSIRKSDIIALIDNLEKVDYLNLNSIYLKPYYRRLNGNNELLADLIVTDKATDKISWRFQFDGNFIRVYKDNDFEGNITLGTEFTDSKGTIKVTVQPNAYQLGDEWVFTTYPFNNDLAIDDFTVPVINTQLSTIKVNKQIII